MTTGEPLVHVRDLVVEFPGARNRLAARSPAVRAVAGISFEIARRETFGLVGESGSGKSTTARALLQLVRPASGSVTFDGTELTTLRGGALRKVRRRMQMVFQDPYSSLDPSSVVGDSIAEPLAVHQKLRGSELEREVAALLERVGLPAASASRYPYEFSGGQRQRIAVARAIALRPDFVVCDEAVSALDVSTQNQVTELLAELGDEFGMSYLFIAHDLAVVRHIADRVGVMYLGELVETGPVDRIFERPAHPYTRALLSAVPLPHPIKQAERERIVLRGDMPDPANPPSGCRFHTRCPDAMDICATERPETSVVVGGGTVACHRYPTGQSASAPVEFRSNRAKVI